jgi:hypothetical protein
MLNKNFQSIRHGEDALSEANNISQDPRFVDAANGDYRLRPDSPSTARPEGSGLDMSAY